MPFAFKFIKQQRRPNVVTKKTVSRDHVTCLSAKKTTKKTLLLFILTLMSKE